MGGTLDKTVLMTILPGAAFSWYAGCYDIDIRYDHVCVRGRFGLGKSVRRTVAAGTNLAAADKPGLHLIAIRPAGTAE
jgi:hypothetical protein